MKFRPVVQEMSFKENGQRPITIAHLEPLHLGELKKTVTVLITYLSPCK